MAEPSPTASSTESVSDLVAGARRARGVAEIDAAEADSRRRLTDETVRSLVSAGFARHLVPERWGGAAGSFRELTDAVAVVGEGCAAAAWCGSLAAYGGRYGAFLPLDGQREIWGDGPDTLIAGAIVPSGRAEPVDGGWRVTGKWSYVSTVDFAAYAIVCSPATDSGVRYFAVPQESFEIVDSWYNVGMRGTGSNILVLDDIFVPARRSFSRDAVAEGRSVGSDAACHTAELRAVLALPFAAPVLGAARGTLAAATDWIAKRVEIGGQAAREKPTVQLELARSAGQIDAAELLLRRISDALDQGLGAGPGSGAGPGDQAVIARNGRDTSLAVEFLTEATDRLFRLVGTGGQAQGHPMERFWRDVHAAASHVTLQLERTAPAWAATRFDGALAEQR